MLDIRELAVARSEKAPLVLEDVSIRVNRGEKVAILGSSGAGETTLFRAIGDFVPIRSGTISIDEIKINDLRGKRLRDVRRRVAMISQRHDMVDRLKVYQNVMAGALGRWSTLRSLRFLAWPRSDEMVEAEQALSRVALAAKLRSRTSDLSGGEHQRVAIARALVQKPTVLLADEPVASLDPDLSGQILDLLCRLAQENDFALLCSLHQPEYAFRYFDRVIRIERGRIESDSAVRQSFRAGA